MASLATFLHNSKKKLIEVLRIMTETNEEQLLVSPPPPLIIHLIDSDSIISKSLIGDDKPLL